MQHHYQVLLNEEDVWSYYLHQLVTTRRKRSARRSRSWLLRLLAGILISAVYLLEGGFFGAIIFLLLYVLALGALTGLPGMGSLLFDKDDYPRSFFARWLKKRMLKNWMQPQNNWLLQPMQMRLTDNGLTVNTRAGEKTHFMQDLACAETLEHFYFKAKRGGFYILPKRVVGDIDAVSKWTMHNS